MIGLVDANNFYVSCERLFRPDLENRPVIVLSNNDGCVVSRSNEAKALGIPMAAPVFCYRDLIKQHHVHVFSSNYALYGEMSSRIMSIVQEAVPRMEIYSIDEAFLDLSFLKPSELLPFAQALSEKVKQWTGIPISIGISATKTLAKVANATAKQGFQSVYSLGKDDEIIEALSQLRLDDIWGISSRWTQQLLKHGITTPLQLREMRPELLKKKLNVIIARTALELRGSPCFALEDKKGLKKSITSSRSFGRNVTTLKDLEESIAYHAKRIGEKLRSQDLSTPIIGIQISTSRHQVPNKKYRGYQVCPLPVSTCDTSVLIAAALKALHHIYKPGYIYKKSGVMALETIRLEQLAPTLFEDKASLQRRHTLMATIDQLNARFGSHTLTFASEGLKQSWRAKSELKSPSFFSSWDDLPEVR